jgi:hypothetical protein
MIVRFVVPAMAAAGFGLLATSVLAAQATPPTAMQTCTQLEAQVAGVLPEAIPSMLGKATKERAEGAKLCESGQTDQGIATLERAKEDALYRG